MNEQKCDCHVRCTCQYLLDELLSPLPLSTCSTPPLAALELNNNNVLIEESSTSCHPCISMGRPATTCFDSALAGTCIARITEGMCVCRDGCYAFAQTSGEASASDLDLTAWYALCLLLLEILCV